MVAAMLSLSGDIASDASRAALLSSPTHISATTYNIEELLSCGFYYNHIIIVCDRMPRCHDAKMPIAS